MKRILHGQIKITDGGAFLIGALVGVLFFGLFYSFSLAVPTNTDWIWHSITRDTAQHQLGWEMYRATGKGATIQGLAYPAGLSIVYMDVIPLLALTFKPLSGILPSQFQYFGLWSLLCYTLMGGLAAVLLRRIWRKFYSSKATLWQVLYLVAGSLFYVLSPMVLARTLYHPALAGQWLILLGFLVFDDTPRAKHWWQLMLIWCAVLALTILIHPYFLPMLGAIMLLSIIRYFDKLDLGGTVKIWLRVVVMVLVPAAVSLGIFYTIGGFSQSGAEIYDLAEKGFNLTSFANAMGYSRLVLGFLNRSTSPETMMWLGLGVWLMIIICLALLCGKHRLKYLWAKFRLWWGFENRQRHICYLIVAVLLFVFAVGVRVDVGPISLFQFTPPAPIYKFWTAFRAAAREAWPFYYALIFGIIYCLLYLINRAHFIHRGFGWRRKYLPIISATVLAALVLIQAVDFLLSPNVAAKYEGFKVAKLMPPEYVALDLGELARGKQNLLPLDDNARGDHSGTYILGRTALKYDMNMGVGFYARVPAGAEAAKETWQAQARNGKLSAKDLQTNLYVVKDANLVDKIGQHYELKKVGGRWFIDAAR